MALTQEQILQFRRENGIPEQGYGTIDNAINSAGSQTSTGSTAGSDWWEQAKQQIVQNQPKPAPAPERFKAPGILGSIQDVAHGAAKAGTESALKIGHLGQKIQGAVGKGLDAAINVAGGESDLAGQADEGIFSPTSEQGMAARDMVERTNTAEKIGAGIERVAEMAVPIGGAPARTVLGKTAEGALIGGGIGGANAIAEDESAGEVAKDAAIGALAGGALGTVGGLIGKAVGNKTPTEKLNQAIDAVNPNLGGKKTVQGYKDLALGKRDVKGGTLTKRQELTAPKEIQELGTRLSDVIKSKNPISNLRSLGKGLQEAEAKLDDALIQGDPAFQYVADKPGLANKLLEGESKIPREYAAIRDSKSVYKNVFNFAKGLIDEGDDSIAGLRDMRSAFDYQARLEYPNAFKEGGSIDVKTPAGRAIKQVRDIINDHLYETAPNGSQIKELIRREADIFRAIDNIAPKAAETHGLTTVDKLVQSFTRHPYVAGLLGVGAIGAAAGGGAAVVKAATGSGGSSN